MYIYIYVYSILCIPIETGHIHVDKFIISLGGQQDIFPPACSTFNYSIFKVHGSHQLFLGIG